MLDKNNPRAVAGGNNPPFYRAEIVEAHEAKAAKFLDAAGEWLEIKTIETDEDASLLSDFIAGVKKNIKLTDEDRKTDKKPHDAAGEAVQAAYNPIIEKMKRAIERVTPMQTAWLTKKDAERRAEAERRRREAEAAARAAEEAAAKAAIRHDIAGEVEAEKAAKRAKELEREAARLEKQRSNVKSASGGGRTTSLRTYVSAKVTNVRTAFMYYQDCPEVADCLKALAEREARDKRFDPAKDKIPGIEFIIERRAV